MDLDSKLADIRNDSQNKAVILEKQIEEMEKEHELKI